MFKPYRLCASVALCRAENRKGFCSPYDDSRQILIPISDGIVKAHNLKF
jgi:hypothetical protein